MDFHFFFLSIPFYRQICFSHPPYFRLFNGFLYLGRKKDFLAGISNVNCPTLNYPTALLFRGNLPRYPRDNLAYIGENGI